MSQRQLEDLRGDQCRELLSEGQVGRLVYVDAEGPAAIPVNYALDGPRLLFRIEHGGKEDRLEGPVAFQIDHVDEDTRGGWSVLVRGIGRQVPLPEVPAVLERIGGRFPRPWAAGVHSAWFEIDPVKITGKRFGGFAET